MANDVAGAFFDGEQNSSYLFAGHPGRGACFPDNLLYAVKVFVLGRELGINLFYRSPKHR